MEARELRKMTTEELRAKLDESYERLMNFRFQLSIKQLKDHNLLTSTKRDIARLKTILRERELAQEEERVE
ncbi:MAG: 50S ribosomal protein L29 [Anaerolineae bacterium]|jgi:large subunit ribosomal protein L29|nr:50S ribosomal protein L29 [Anaerolineae bacterium]MDH7473493.1 50S ribosomal protein L29 [Anaerolineae bacterium]